MQLQFLAYTSQTWDVKRYQPMIFLADEKEFPFAVPAVEGNRIVGDLQGRPTAALHLRWRIPSFGEVTLPTGQLAPCDQPYNVNIELARRRLALLDEKTSEWGREGFAPSEATAAKIERARATLAFLNASQPEEVNTRWADLSLSISVPAGEALALEYAEWGIRQKRARGLLKDFLLGSTFFFYPEYGEQYAEHFARALNFATVPFYWGRYEPQPGKLATRDKVKRMVAWLKAKGITVKGHPLLYCSSSPKWLSKDDVPLYKRKVKERIVREVSDFKGDIQYWDVINEMQHFNPFSREVAIEMARICASTVKEVDPRATRIVNCDDPFGEYMANRPAQDFHPFDYFDQIISGGVDFDVIGIQLYFGAAWTYCRDLFEMSRYFDRYRVFNKPLHVSELGAPSSEAVDPNDTSGHVEQAVNYHGKPWMASDAGFWHEPWTQKTQADWGESMYKVLMGKPFVKAITWWDFTDHGHHFYTHAGLLDPDNNPKELHRRIAALKDGLTG